MYTNLPRRRFLQSTLLASAALPYARLFAAADASLPELEAVTADGNQILLKGADIRDFAARLRGELLLANSAGYETARHVWNGAFDRHPAMIARCSGAADVMEAVSFAASNNLLLSVRGGGHSLSGQSVCEKGLMIDLSLMNGVKIDVARRVAYVEGGALLGALDREALAVGLATTAGTVSHTGVGGLTLGGGFGRLARKYGLTCDNVRSIDLVNARGKFANVNDRSDRELFWGLRGGGGNFGVATSFELQLHPVDPMMVGGQLAYSWEDSPAMLKHYFDFCATAPDELNIDAILTRLPNDVRFLSLDVTWCGPRERADAVLKPLREFRKPIRDTVTAAPYVALQKSGDDALSHGHRYYVKAGFLQKFNPALVDAAIATIAEANLPVVQVVVMSQVGGAIARVKPNATAFAQRAATHSVMLLSRWDDPGTNDAISAWIKSSWKKVEPLTHGFYVNDYTPEDATRMSTTYGANFTRLVALKAKADPNNLFRLNANVAPIGKA
jgi:hypothetical protein